MPSNAAGKRKAAEPAAAANEKTFNLGPPHGKVKASLTAPLDMFK